MNTYVAPTAAATLAPVPSIAALVFDSTTEELRDLVEELASAAPTATTACALFVTHNGATYPATDAPCCRACCEAMAVKGGYLLAAIREVKSFTSCTGLLHCACEADDGTPCGAPLLADLMPEGILDAFSTLEERLTDPRGSWGPTDWRDLATLLAAAPVLGNRARDIIAAGLMIAGSAS